MAGPGPRITSDGRIIMDGAVLDPAPWVRSPVETGKGRDVTCREAFVALREIGPLLHLVVGVIGPRAATQAQRSAAEAVGAGLATAGVTMICGGRSGVMEAASRGCAQAGGLPVGILPGSTPDEANAHIAIPLPTGLGEARNMVIAKAARVLIAVGNSHGTLSEVAYGLQFGKPVIGLEGAARVEGVRHATTVDAALEQALGALLQAAPMEAGSGDHGT